MSTLKIETAKAFEPLLGPARYKGAWGGRGSGKSHFFAGLLVEDALDSIGRTGEGLRAVCIREVQKSLKESAKRLVEDKLSEYKLGEAQGFKVYKELITTPGDGVIIFQGMSDQTAESIKSLEGYKRAWIEEGQSLSKTSLTLLRPTIRDDDSEIWVSWNPRRKTDPVDDLLRLNPPTGSVVVRANWSDNPWFPKVLEQERLDCLESNPDEYQHIWEGDYAGMSSGAYFAKQIALAKQENRIGHVSADPNLIYRVYVDIGGTGARADAFTMWVAQFVGKEIRVLDYYEAVGQPIAAHLEWLRGGGYNEDNTKIWLPHDGRTNDRVYNVSYESALKSAGFEVSVVPNQGAGAAKARIEAARKLFNSMWFSDKCESGIDALAWYHEKRDENRGIGLGPNHDWASHGADSFGLMALCYEEPKRYKKPVRNYPQISIA